jgi:ABC-2 type transport system permease protein
MAKPESTETSDVKQIGIVTKYELLKYLRRRRLYAVLIITAMITALQFAVPLALNSPFPEQAKEWASGFLGFANLLIIISGAFFAGDAIASEFEHKTGFIIFPNPVKRTSLVFGKFLAAFISSLLTVGLYYLIGVIGLLGIYGFVLLEMAASFAYAVLFLCSVLGLTFLFSTVMKGSMGATLLAFFTLFMIMPIVSQVITLTGNEPWYLPTYVSGMMTQVIYPQTDTVMEFPGSPLKLYVFYPKFPISLIVMLAYFIAALALSLRLVNRKEMA